MGTKIGRYTSEISCRIVMGFCLLVEIRGTTSKRSRQRRLSFAFLSGMAYRIEMDFGIWYWQRGDLQSISTQSKLFFSFWCLHGRQSLTVNHQREPEGEQSQDCLSSLPLSLPTNQVLPQHHYPFWRYKQKTRKRKKTMDGARIV